MSEGVSLKTIYYTSTREKGLHLMAKQQYALIKKTTDGDQQVVAGSLEEIVEWVDGHYYEVDMPYYMGCDVAFFLSLDDELVRFVKEEIKPDSDQQVTEVAKGWVWFTDQLDSKQIGEQLAADLASAKHPDDTTACLTVFDDDVDIEKINGAAMRDIAESVIEQVEYPIHAEDMPVTVATVEAYADFMLSQLEPTDQDTYSVVSL